MAEPTQIHFQVADQPLLEQCGFRFEPNNTAGVLLPENFNSNAISPELNAYFHSANPYSIFANTATDEDHFIPHDRLVTYAQLCKNPDGKTKGQFYYWVQDKTGIPVGVTKGGVYAIEGLAVGEFGRRIIKFLRTPKGPPKGPPPPSTPLPSDEVSTEADPHSLTGPAVAAAEAARRMISQIDWADVALWGGIAVGSVVVGALCVEFAPVIMANLARQGITRGALMASARAFTWAGRGASWSALA